MSPPSPDSAPGFTRRVVRLPVKRYYGKVEVSDRDRIPQTGPVLLCANHPNALFDPVLVGIAARRPVRFLAKAPLFEKPVLGPLMQALGMISVYRASDDRRQIRRNLESLDVGARALAEGTAVGIFPEGRSHDLPTVESIHTGAARMALQAVEAGARGLQVVPVGLNYERKEDFHSAVWIRVGEPIDVDQCLAEHGGNPRNARNALTQRLEQGLRRVVIHLDNPEWEPYLDDLEVLVPAAGSRARETIFPLRQRKWLAEAMNHLSTEDHPRAEETARAIRTYRDHVHAAGLATDAPVLRSSGWRMAWTLLWQSLCMVLLLGFSLLGTLFHIVPFTIVRMIAARLQRPGRTDISFYRLLVGLPAYLLWYGAAGWWLFFNFHATTWFGVSCLLVMPIIGVFTLSYWRTTKATGLLWWHQVRFLFSRPRLRQLRQEREELRNRLSALADAYHQKSPRPEPPPRRSRRVLARRVLAATVILLALGAIAWYAPRLMVDRPLVETGFDLQSLPPDRLHREMERDEESLTSIIRGLGDLKSRATAVRQDFVAGKRNYDNEADNDAVRQLLLSYINYRAALIRLVWKYLNYDDLPTERDRLRAFLLDYTAAMVLCQSSMEFVNNFTRDEARHDQAIARLNEGEPVWGIPPGLYDTIEKNLASLSSRRQLASAGEYYQRSLKQFDEHQLGAHSRHAPFHAAIQEADRTITALGGEAWREKSDIASKELLQLIATVKYDVQSAVSTWMGDVKISERRDGRALIPPEHVEQLRPMLKPGDILIERRNWYVSNAFLPGYWPHAVIYVGTAEDLKRLGLDQHPFVQKHWERFCRPDPEGHPHVIIEALSDGVIFSSLEHSIGGGDSAAVLRPRVGQEEINQAITRAFGVVGREYDFEFDFDTHEKLVCTEVVYRAYGANQGVLRFPVLKIMGRNTMPAIELVRKYRQERDGEAQLELIAFIDGNEQTGRTTFSTDPDDFVTTLDRPPFTFAQDVVHEPVPGMGYLGWALLALIVTFTVGNLIHYGRAPHPRLR